VIWGLTAITAVSPIAQFLVALIGLGVSIDYSLLVVVRWREERARGRDGDEAVQRAMETAGRAVVFSGSTVAIGLLALVALPVPVSALGRLRRHADPPDQRDRRHDAAASRPGHDRAQTRLAA
jgi:predicted RND superfamily exporter protein